MTERESITFQERYVGAMITANVFKALFLLWLIAGVFIMIRTDSSFSTIGTSGLSLFIVLLIEGVATILGAAMFAFFAYVLELLMGIWEETAGENE
jgi:hypothetical protein